MATSEIDYRPHRPEEAADVTRLLSACFNPALAEKTDPRHLVWEYAPSPQRPAIAWNAWRGAQLVGHYAAIRVTVATPRGPQESACCVNLACHPDWRRHGVFRELHRRLEADLLAEGVGWIHAFPNRRNVSYRGFTDRLLFRDLDWPVLRARPFRAWRVLRQVLAPPRPEAVTGGAPKGLCWPPAPAEKPESKLQIRRLDDFGAEADELWSAVQSMAPVCAPRSAAWLRWRYRDNPCRGYVAWGLGTKDSALAAWIVTRGSRWGALNVGLIVDGLGRTREAMALLSRVVVSDFRLRGFDIVGALASSSHPAEAAWGDAGLLAVPFLLNPDPVVLVGRTLAPDARDRIEKWGPLWATTWGDFDVT